ncbi:hypothetical protein GJU39_16035 [Pedobacter petrophilus]|uniref:Beta-lactamase-inhibitor-like PepSY-like domain-containing protein n=1 Tax=Pedobacter petrophilus TaxID=1908241 RepID=A0A7K0G177_9SPHI|nr:hypothetical protein [Pedobacter petrophilus]MRX77598.1 hypothetical protein [Pedobacter petrophilus]
MKRIFGIFLFMGGMVTVTFAQKVAAAKVPASVKTAFAKNHPGIKEDWEMEKKNYEAEFTLNGKETSEVYTTTGFLIETEVSIKSSEFPAAVLAKLKGMKIAESAKITKADGTVKYEAEVKGRDLLFDANGNRVKP